MAGSDDDDDFAERADRTVVLRQNFAAAVAAVLDEAADREPRRPQPSSTFAQALADVAWSWTTTALAPDLEAFARHAKRSKIGVDDVLLASRKNEVTHALMEREAANLRTVRQKGADGDK